VGVGGLNENDLVADFELDPGRPGGRRNDLAAVIGPRGCDD